MALTSRVLPTPGGPSSSMLVAAGPVGLVELRVDDGTQHLFFNGQTHRLQTTDVLPTDVRRFSFVVPDSVGLVGNPDSLIGCRVVFEQVAGSESGECLASRSSPAGLRTVLWSPGPWARILPSGSKRSNSQVGWL